MVSPKLWTWVWVSSGSWWWTGKPGVLQSMGLQRVGHDWATKLNWGSYQHTESNSGSGLGWNPIGRIGIVDRKGQRWNPGELQHLEPERETAKWTRKSFQRNKKENLERNGVLKVREQKFQVGNSVPMGQMMQRVAGPEESVHLAITGDLGGFPGGPVTNTLCSQCSGPGLNP